MLLKLVDACCQPVAMFTDGLAAMMAQAPHLVFPPSSLMTIRIHFVEEGGVMPVCRCNIGKDRLHPLHFVHCAV